jgi:Protein of unknown function (DUF4038)/Putative collagen-binding domain of a collagenase
MKIQTCLLLIVAMLFSTVTTVKAQVAFPVKISNDKRYLVDQNNKPFPILGRTAWFIVSQPDSGYKKFLDNTLANGYNSIELSVITHWAMGNHAPFNANGDAPFLKRLNGNDWDGKLIYTDVKTASPDLLTPNENYWKHVDELLAYCESKGILVFMFPGYVGYANEKEEQGWMKELVANGTKTEQYGAWFANRYKQRKNIIWMLLGDKGQYTQEQAKAEAALIKGLKSVPGQQSVQYTAESNSGENAADNAQFGHEMTVNGSYTWELKVPVPFIARKAYAHHPVMPSFLLEEPYDEEGPDGNNYNPNATQPVRRFQWWGWLSTIGGYISGNAYIWQFVDPIWQQHLNTQGAMDMSRLNGFIQSVNWWQLVPSGLNGMSTLITYTDNADTSAAYVSAAAAKDGSLLVAYVPPAHTGSIDVNMSVLSKKVFAQWFDPTNATYHTINDAPFNNKGIHSFTPPGKNSTGENDWVLVLSVRKR